jgi:hypothetical protein
MKKLTHRQQLKLIEGLCILWENSDRTNDLAEDIYKIAHLNGTCKNSHLDWLIEAHKLGEELKKQGIIDYKKEK